MLFKFSLRFYIVSIFCLLTSFIYGVDSASGFEDHFTSDPNFNPNWIVQNDVGLIFNNPGITLTSSNSRSFPYLKTNMEGELGENKYFEITFRYTQSDSPWGAGFSFTDISPNFPTYLGEISDYENYNISYVFGEKLHAVSMICPALITNCQNPRWFIYPNSLPSNDYDLSTMGNYDKHTYSVLRSDLSDGTYSYDLYLDSKKLMTTSPTMRKIKSIWIGHPSTLDSNKNWPILEIFSVKSFQEKPASFPYLSQLDDRWGDEVYDTATTWAGEQNDGIDSWGCALTSTAMMLQHYGIKDLEGGEVDPAKLNSWLKAEPDGYLGPGLINWIAVTRYAKESFDAGLSPTKLEFSRSYDPTTAELPSILGIPGHFVVAYDQDDKSWTINDPASTDKTKLLKSSIIKSVNRFVPSQTDLSYMLFAMPSFIEASLASPSEEVVPVTWVDEYLTDDTGGQTGATLRTGMIPKLKSGKYKFTLTNPGSLDESIHFYFYDDLGGLTKLEKSAKPGTQSIWIDYFADDTGNSTISESDVTAPDTPTVISPSTGSFVKASGLNLDWSDVDDPSKPITYYYKSSWNGGSYGPVSTGSNSFINASGSAERTYTWQVQACDKYGNCSPWSSSVVTIDSTPPTTSEISHPSEGQYFRTAPILNEWSSASDANGVDHYLIEYQYDDGHTFSDYPYRTTTINNRNHSPSIAEQGGVKFRVQAIDKAGNIGDWSQWRYYFYDATAPTAPIFLNVDPITNSPDQLWSWTASSDKSGTGISGYYNREYSVTDNLLGEWGWLGDVLSSSTTLGEGVWQMELKSVDKAGNESEVVRSEQIVVDLTPPAIPKPISPINNAIVNGAFLLSDWTDSAGANSYIYESYHDEIAKNLRYRGEFKLSEKSATNVADSIFWWRIRAKDAANNMSEWSEMFKVTIDNIKPIFKAKTTFHDWYRTPQTSFFEFSDANMPKDFLNPWCEVATEGIGETCTTSTNVCDLAGNCASGEIISNPVNQDFGLPSIVLQVWGRTISGTASDSLSGIKSVVLKITKPGQSEADITPSGLENWSYTIPDAPLGLYKVRMTAYDWAGNTSEEIVKEYYLNPANSEMRNDENTGDGTTVLGATAESPKNTNKSLSKKRIIEPTDTPTPSPKIENTEIVNRDNQLGQVLGEKEMKKSGIRYLWLIIPLTIIILLIVRKWIKSKET